MTRKIGGWLHGWNSSVIWHLVASLASERSYARTILDEVIFTRFKTQLTKPKLTSTSSTCVYFARLFLPIYSWNSIQFVEKFEWETNKVFSIPFFLLTLFFLLKKISSSIDHSDRENRCSRIFASKTVVACSRGIGCRVTIYRRNRTGASLERLDR